MPSGSDSGDAPPLTLAVLAERMAGMTALLDERSRAALDQITANREFLALATADLKELLLVGQANADKAILKAEDAQRYVNASSNEWRAAMTEKDRLMMTRTEFEGVHRAINSALGELRADIVRLRESAAGQRGGERRTDILTQRQEWGIGAFVGIALGGSSIVIALIGLALSIAWRR